MLGMLGNTTVPAVRVSRVLRDSRLLVEPGQRRGPGHKLGDAVLYLGLHGGTDPPRQLHSKLVVRKLKRARAVAHHGLRGNHAGEDRRQVVVPTVTEQLEFVGAIRLCTRLDHRTHIRRQEGQGVAAVLVLGLSGGQRRTSSGVRVAASGRDMMERLWLVGVASHIAFSLWVGLLRWNFEFA
jgi:hypothetical protein